MNKKLRVGLRFLPQWDLDTEPCVNLDWGVSALTMRLQQFQKERDVVLLQWLKGEGDFLGLHLNLALWGCHFLCTLQQVVFGSRILGMESEDNLNDLDLVWAIWCRRMARHSGGKKERTVQSSCMAYVIRSKSELLIPPMSSHWQQFRDPVMCLTNMTQSWCFTFSRFHIALKRAVM